MDYSEINNFLGNLTVSGNNLESHNTINHQFDPKTNIRHIPNQTQVQTESNNWNNFNKSNNSIELKKQSAPDLFLNRNMELVNSKRHNQYLSYEAFNPQRASMSSTDHDSVSYSKLNETRNNQINYSQNIMVMDYNLFSENYKNKNVLDENDKDKLNQKMESRGNTPTKPLPYSHKF